MKFILSLLLVAGMMISCNGNSKETAGSKEAKEQSKSSLTLNAISIDSLLNNGALLANKEAVVKGYVTHTCKHSGRRCFIVGEDQKTTLRVEAKGEIGGFNRELIGSELAIKGIVKERRLTKEYLEQYAEQLKEKEDGSAESCQSEQKNVLAMQEWMKKNNKDYYSTYYMDGESFEVIENE